MTVGKVRKKLSKFDDNMQLIVLLRTEQNGKLRTQSKGWTVEWMHRVSACKEHLYLSPGDDSKEVCALLVEEEE